MINVERRSFIENATPEEVFAALSEPGSLSNLLPRVRKVDMLARNETSARLATHMSLGGIFGTIRCEGDLTWTEPSEIVFKVRTPLPVDTVWKLSPALGGTELVATMGLNLSPLLGPMAQFVPVEPVAEMIGKELDAALEAITKRCARPDLEERAVAA
jgi:hypothetical protein